MTFKANYSGPWYYASYDIFRPGVHKAFQNKDQDQAQLKNSSTMDCF